MNALQGPWKSSKRIAGRTVAKGDTVSTSLKVSETTGHQAARVPVLVVRAEQDGPTVFVTGAVHGDEVLGAALVRRLLDTLERRLLAGTLVAVPVVNVFGFEASERYLPDRRDLNRHFPGDPSGSLASRIAHEVFRSVVLPSDLGVDLHTASTGHANLCHVRGDAADPRVHAMMKAFGVPIRVDTRGPKGSLRRAATEAGVPTVLYEAGEPGRFQPHAVAMGHDGVLRLLQRLHMTQGRLRGPGFQTLVRSSRWQRSDHGGLLQTLVQPGDLVRSGQVLAHVVDPLGVHVDSVRSDRSGVVLGIATNPLARPGMAVAHIGVLERSLTKARAYANAGGDLGHLGQGGSGSP